MNCQSWNKFGVIKMSTFNDRNVERKVRRKKSHIIPNKKKPLYFNTSSYMCIKFGYDCKKTLRRNFTHKKYRANSRNMQFFWSTSIKHVTVSLDFESLFDFRETSLCHKVTLRFLNLSHERLDGMLPASRMDIHLSWPSRRLGKFVLKWSARPCCKVQEIWRFCIRHNVIW